MRVPLLTITMPSVPDYGRIGANARHRTWRSRWLSDVNERNKWIEQLVALGYGSREQPVLSGELSVDVTLWFTTKRYPDQADNLLAGLKHLFDVLEVSRIVNRNMTVRGFAGIYENDKQLRLLNPPTVIVNRDIAPMTQVAFYQRRSNGAQGG